MKDVQYTNISFPLSCYLRSIFEIHEAAHGIIMVAAEKKYVDYKLIM